MIKAYYGADPSKSYYVGCSQGGHEGLMEAQRYPEDFDGYVVGAPVLDLTGHPDERGNIKARPFWGTEDIPMEPTPDPG